MYVSSVRAGQATRQMTDALYYPPSLSKEQEKGNEGFTAWKTKTALIRIIIIMQFHIYIYTNIYTQIYQHGI